MFSSQIEAKSKPQNGPPPEAYTACKEKRHGETAEFMNPFGDIITGTCVKGQRQLFLRPDFPPERKKNEQRSSRQAAQQ